MRGCADPQKRLIVFSNRFIFRYMIDSSPCLASSPCLCPVSHVFHLWRRYLIALLQWSCEKWTPELWGIRTATMMGALSARRLCLTIMERYGPVCEAVGVIRVCVAQARWVSMNPRFSFFFFPVMSLDHVRVRPAAQWEDQRAVGCHGERAEVCRPERLHQLHRLGRWWHCYTTWF